MNVKRKLVDPAITRISQMPDRAINIFPHLQVVLSIALACLAPNSLMASHISDAEMQKLLTMQPVSAAEIINPGAIQARYSQDGTIFNIAVINGEDGIDFMVKFEGIKVSLEDLNQWNTNTYFQAFRADGDKVGINTRLFLPKGGFIGDVVPTPGYITLTYLEFAGAVKRFHQFLIDHQESASNNQSSITSKVITTPPTPESDAKLPANPAQSVVATSSQAPKSVPTATTPTTDQQQWTFPEINEAFSRRSELQREPFSESVKGTLLSGRGNITEVGRCGFLDNSIRHGNNCLKITLDNDQPRAVLYFPKSRQDDLSALEVGDGYRFSNCTVISITDYGFWTTVTCDMP